MKLKNFGSLLTLLWFFLMSSPACAAEKTASANLQTTAEAAVLEEAYTGKEMYAKNPDLRLPMASVTKLMTLLLAIEAEEQGKIKLSDRVAASEHASSMGGSQIFLAQGEEMSLKDLLTAVAVGSANDASVAVAEHIAGSEESFVQDMNERAAKLGCANTHFANCTGLPAPEHYTSARDMARIMREGIRHPLFLQLSGIKEYDLRGGKFKLWNTNKLLWWYKGADSGKTGWTNEARYCLAASAQRDGLRLVSVVLGTAETKSHFRETIKIMNYGFAAYRAVNLAKEGEKIGELPVDKGSTRHVDVVTGGWVTVVVPRGQEKGFTTRLDLPSTITAPVTKGKQVGYYIALKENREMLRVPLVAAKDVGRANLVTEILRSVEGVLTTSVFATPSEK